MTTPKLKHWASNLILVPVGLLCGALILEIGLRIAGISYPSFYIEDEHMGYALRPGAEGWYREEGEAYIRINSEGLRDREHTKVKPADTLRVAVLGDSVAEARQVPLDQTFWMVMEQEFENCDAVDGKKVELINFGVSGYGTGHELTTLRHRVWDYDPDLVVLAFFTGNDIRNNSIDTQQKASSLRFVFRDGELVADMAFTQSAAYRLYPIRRWFLEHWRVLQVARIAKDVLLDKLESAQIGQDAGDAAHAEPGLDDMIYFEPGDPAWIEAWRVTEELIRLMNDEVTEKGAEFLVVTLSNPIQVHPDPSVRRAFLESLNIRDLFYPERRIKGLGERENFAVLNLAEPFQSYAEEGKVFLHGFENATLGKGHWNAEGHNLAGIMIAQHICNQLLSGR